VEGENGLSNYLNARVVDGIPYLGLGLGAQTFSLRSLSYNVGADSKELKSYVDKNQHGVLPIQDIHHLSKEAAMAKMISVAFYSGGINLESFRRNFGITFQEAFSEEVKYVIENELMEFTLGDLQLTEKGEQYYNGIIALFYSGSVKKHLIELNHK